MAEVEEVSKFWCLILLILTAFGSATGFALPNGKGLRHQVLIGALDAFSGAFSMEPLCFGSIIKDQWVLTSKKCAEGMGTTLMKTYYVLPRLHVNQLSNWMPVNKSYLPSESTSLAILQMQDKFQWSETLQPIQLEPSKPDWYYYDYKVFANTLAVEQFEGIKTEYAWVRQQVKVKTVIDPNHFCEDYYVHETGCGILDEDERKGKQFYWTSGSAIQANGKLVGVITQDGNSSHRNILISKITVNVIKWIHETCSRDIVKPLIPLLPLAHSPPKELVESASNKLKERIQFDRNGMRNVGIILIISGAVMLEYDTENVTLITAKV